MIPAKLFSSSVLIFIGLLFRIVIIMLFELISARYFGPDLYGAYSFAFTIILIASTIPTLGLQNALRRFIALYKEKGEKLKVKGLVYLGLLWPLFFGTFVAVAVYYSSEYVVISLLKKPEVEPLVKIMALIIPIFAMRKLAVSIFSGYKKAKYKVAVDDFLEPLSRLGAVLIISILGLNIIQYGYATLFAYLLIGAIVWVLVNQVTKDLTLNKRSMELPLKPLVLFAAPMVVSEFLDVILAWLNIVMLGILSTDIEVGFFRAASQPAILVSTILTCFAFIYMPVATELYARKNYVQWKEINNSIALWTMSLAFPVGAICVLYPGTIIGILFGKEYLEGIQVLQILGITYLFHSGCGFTGLNLIIGGRSTLQMIGKVFTLVVNIWFNILWIPEFGAVGAAMATFASVIINNIFNLSCMAIIFGLWPFQCIPYNE